MPLFAQVDILATAIITAVTSILVAVLPVWLRLRHERAMHDQDIQKSKKKQDTLASDVDQLENREEELTMRIADLEQELADARQLNEDLRKQLERSNAAPSLMERLKAAASKQSHNPPLQPTLARGQRGGRKRAYLVGAQPKGKSVQWLVKVHDYLGKAIYVYDLVTGKSWQEADSSTPDIDERITRYGQIGHEIDHPGISRTKPDQWIAHAKSQAKTLGITVESQPAQP